MLIKKRLMLVLVSVVASLFLLLPSVYIAGLTANQVRADDISSSENFTVVALPDTQHYSQKYPEIFRNQTQWIADNKDALNIKLVVHEGDITNKNTTPEWQNAKEAMDILTTANVTYLITPGNHDIVGKKLSLDNFINYFGDTNSYYILGDFLFIALNGISLEGKTSPSDVAANCAWANDLLESYPEKKAVVITHGYLDSNGLNRISNGVIDSQSMWNKCIKKNGNIAMVWCGHWWEEAHTIEVGANHTVVHDLMCDYQDMKNGGNGYLRLYTINPTINEVFVTTYSPYLDKWKTDKKAQFTFTLFERGDYPLTKDAPKTNKGNTGSGSSGGGGGGGSGGGAVVGEKRQTSILYLQDSTMHLGEDVEALSADCKVSLFLAKGTLVQNCVQQIVNSIVIEKMDDTLGGYSRAGALGSVYCISPSGVSFNPSGKISISYNPKELLQGIDAHLLGVGCWDAINKKWDIVWDCEVDTIACKISAKIDHSSTYALIKTSESVAVPQKAQPSTDTEVSVIISVRRVIIGIGEKAIAYPSVEAAVAAGWGEGGQSTWSYMDGAKVVPSENIR